MLNVEDSQDHRTSMKAVLVQVPELKSSISWLAAQTLHLKSSHLYKVPHDLFM